MSSTFVNLRCFSSAFPLVRKSDWTCASVQATVVNFWIWFVRFPLESIGFTQPRAYSLHCTQPVLAFQYSLPRTRCCLLLVFCRLRFLWGRPTCRAGGYFEENRHRIARFSLLLFWPTAAMIFYHGGVSSLSSILSVLTIVDWPLIFASIVYINYNWKLCNNHKRRIQTQVRVLGDKNTVNEHSKLNKSNASK